MKTQTDMISEMFFNANLEELGLETRVSSASTYVTQTFRDRTAIAQRSSQTQTITALRAAFPTARVQETPLSHKCLVKARHRA